MLSWPVSGIVLLRLLDLAVGRGLSRFPHFDLNVTNVGGQHEVLKIQGVSLLVNCPQQHGCVHCWGTPTKMVVLLCC